MTEITSSDEFLRILRQLIGAWCDRRCLTALSPILPAYLGFNGLTDSWAELLSALRNVRAFAKDELTELEMETVGSLVAAATKAIYGSAVEPQSPPG
jgi:hypothetical protein